MWTGSKNPESGFDRAARKIFTVDGETLSLLRYPERLVRLKAVLQDRDVTSVRLVMTPGDGGALFQIEFLKEKACSCKAFRKN